MDFDPYKLASEWHGGQFTELYKLSSSGTIDDRADCLAEIDEMLARAASPASIEELCFLRDFVLTEAECNSETDCDDRDVDDNKKW